MTTAGFATVPGPEPLRLVLVGAGGMGRTWAAAIGAREDVVLSGWVDLDVDLVQAAAREVAPGGPVVGSDLLETCSRAGAQAVVDVTAPAAHHVVTTAALFAGLPVLGEKPAAETVAQALSLAAASAVTGQLFVVSQSRRYEPHVAAFRAQAARLGRLGALTVTFARAPRFGGFREQMEHPLLLDMAIHPFDTARWLLGAEPVTVWCEEFNPPWSWYAHDACATAVVEFAGGERFCWSGSWCSPGLETSWNGTWRLSGEHGTSVWDGDTPPRTEVVDSAGRAEPSASPEQGGHGIDGALTDFVAALRTGVAPMGEIADNLRSLALVEAALASSSTGRRVLVADVVAAAHERALADEPRADVRAALGRLRY